MPKERCEKCELHKTSCAGMEGCYKLNCIQGKGPKDAKIMIVGTTPGSNECETQSPFTGNTGKKLDECLAKAGLNKEEIFFTYLIKCKTPRIEKTSGNWQDREPLKKEINECKPYLEAEIATIKPNVIIMLGNPVCKNLIGKTGVTSIHGTPYWSEEYQATCIPCRNPSALLRPFSKPEDETDLINDLKFAKESSLTKGFNEKIKIPTNYVLIDTLPKISTLIKRLNTLTEYVYDIETTGLNPDTSDLLGISFSWKEGTGCYIPFSNWFRFYTEEELEIVSNQRIRTEEVIETYVEEGKKQSKKRRVGTMMYELESFWSKEDLEMFLPYLKGIIATDQIRKIGHNLAFDVCYLNSKWNIDIKNANYCTQLADYLPDPERIGDRGLADLAWRLTDMGGYDDGLKGERKFGFMHNDIAELYKYGCADSDCTYRIYLKQKEQIEPFLKLLETVAVPLSIVIREMEYNGVKVDLERVTKLEKEYQLKIDKAEKKLFALSDVREYVVLHEAVQYKEIKKKYLNSKTLSKRYPNCDDYISPKINKFNFGSTKHLRALLTHLNINIDKKTKTGLASTDEKTLLGLKGKHKVIDTLLDLRHLKKIHSTYLKPIPEQAAFDGRLHTSYRLDKTATGRLASSKPNLQNIPKKRDGNDIRDTFIASEGNIMVESDLKQIEYRILAHFVNDGKMIRDIEDGLDIHRRIASEIFNIPEEEVTKEQRSMSKTATFGVPYGRSAQSLAAEFNMPVAEAEDFRNSLLIRYPKVQVWINAMIKMAKEKGYVKTFFGRIRYLPRIGDSNFQMREAEERKVVASCIQGTASDVLAIYTINIRNKLKEMKSKTKMVLTVHDALFFDIPKEEAKEVIKMIGIEMERSITWNGQEIRVPIETETQIGKRWGSLVPYEEGVIVQ